MGESGDRHRLGRETMARVYAWENVPDVPGEFFRVTADHLFAEIWNRPGLTMRDRRMLLFGVVAALGETNVLPVQLDAVLANGELTADELREVALFLTHYVGWPRGSTFNNHVEERLAKHRAAKERGEGDSTRFPGPGGGK